MQTMEEKVRANFAQQSFMRTLGAEITSVTAGAVEIRMAFSPALTQQHQFMHAGAITSILDSACGYAAMTLAPPDGDILSVEFKVNLLAPARGDYFIARAQVKRFGKTLSICTADAFAVFAEEEKLVATMLATMMTVSAQRLAPGAY